MIKIRPSRERGRSSLGWLKSFHSFSFGDYYDPECTSFRDLRVINEDWIQSGQGFEPHSHKDMEIITYVLEGALEHQDSMGNKSVIRSNEVQRMSAGKGVTHSEFNHSSSEPVHLLQIWIRPSKKGLSPGYEQRYFSPEEKRNKLTLIAAGHEHQGVVTIHQDVQLFASVLNQGKSVSHQLKKNRHAWLQVARGSVTLNNTLLKEGDGAQIGEEDGLQIKARDLSEILLFDLS